MSLTVKTMKTKKKILKMKDEKFEKSDGEASETHSDFGDLPEDHSDLDYLLEDAKLADSGTEQEESKFIRNPGWANAMQKILKTNKPKKKKTLVLSRAKKISEVQSKNEKIPFQIESKEGDIKVEFVEKKTTKDLNRDKLRILKKTEKMKHSIRVKRSPLNRPREKLLQRIATKGVVQLFNTVRDQQQEIEKKLVEAGPLEGKREKVLKSIDKRAFLDVLMGGTKSITVDQRIGSEREEDGSEKSNKFWSVLRDDFIMGANLKDWDKEIPEEEESSAPEEMDSD
ncbi:RRP15-like protein [Diachasma alloeum]|uniref:RRP15-like protein n=1 Tax=Diachasma alloeum TaxID=454923 RepID=UPI0007383BBB|nr:RRP15-like protein [Diachasma alloeum]